MTSQKGGRLGLPLILIITCLMPGAKAVSSLRAHRLTRMKINSSSVSVYTVLLLKERYKWLEVSFT